MTLHWGQLVKILSLRLCGLICVGLAHSAAQAFYSIGVLPNSRPDRPAPAVVAPVMQQGVITAIRPDARQIGTQLEIGGKWLLVLTGRTVVRREGLPVGLDALRVGQTISYSMATTTPGETALGVVYAP